MDQYRHADWQYYISAVKTGAVASVSGRKPGAGLGTCNTFPESGVKGRGAGPHRRRGISFKSPRFFDDEAQDVCSDDCLVFAIGRGRVLASATRGLRASAAWAERPRAAGLL